MIEQVENLPKCRPWLEVESSAPQRKKPVGNALYLRSTSVGTRASQWLFYMEADLTTDTIARVSNRVKTLPRLSPAQLRAQWRRTFKSEAPNWPPDLIRRAIANRWQEGVLGGLPMDIERQLNRLVRDLDRASANQAKVGTRYIRHWGGAIHNVLATENGFEYRGKTFKSLTAVAFGITGNHRSGPHFFGVCR